METVGRVLLTLLVPVLWGIFSAWVFDQLRARWGRGTEREQREDTAE